MIKTEEQLPKMIDHEWRMRRLVDISRGSKQMGVEKVNLPAFDLWVIVERLIFFESKHSERINKKRKKKKNKK